MADRVPDLSKRYKHEVSNYPHLLRGRLKSTACTHRKRSFSWRIIGAGMITEPSSTCYECSCGHRAEDVMYQAEGENHCSHR